MKLMRLLTVGRSWNGRKPANYKLQQIALPKFASSVHPSTAAAKVVVGKAAPAVSAPVPVVRIPEAEIKLSSEPVSLGMDKTQKIPAGKVLNRKPDALKISSKTKLVTFLKKQIAAAKKRLFPVRSKKKSGAIATQTEWNLEKVTVARNDLSEADLEIRTPKAATPTTATTAAHKSYLPDLGSVKNTGYKWVKMTSRLFKTSSPFAVGSTEMKSKVAQRDGAEHRELAEKI